MKISLKNNQSVLLPLSVFVAYLLVLGVLLPSMLSGQLRFSGNFTLIFGIPLALVGTVQLVYLFGKYSMNLPGQIAFKKAIKTGELPTDTESLRALSRQLDRISEQYEKITKNKIFIVGFFLIFGFSLLNDLAEQKYGAVLFDLFIMIFATVSYQKNMTVMEKIENLRERVKALPQLKVDERHEQSQPALPEVFIRTAFRALVGYFGALSLMVGILTCVNLPGAPWQLIGVAISLIATGLALIFPYYRLKSHWHVPYIAILLTNISTTITFLHVRMGHHNASAASLPFSEAHGPVPFLAALTFHASFAFALVLFMIALDIFTQEAWSGKKERNIAMGAAILAVVVGISFGFYQQSIHEVKQTTPRNSPMSSDLSEQEQTVTPANSETPMSQDQPSYSNDTVSNEVQADTVSPPSNDVDVTPQIDLNTARLEGQN